jgi:protein SEY1
MDSQIGQGQTTEGIWLSLNKD